MSLVPWLFLIWFLGLVGCSTPVIRLADRHGLSYAPTEDFAAHHPGTTLVLFDYHHDSGLGSGFEGASATPTSVDWVGTLVDRRQVARVLWVSGKALALPNRNARLAWLRRSTAALSPSRRQNILDRVQLTDVETLIPLRLEGPVVVSLDLDILTKNPGHDPEGFLDEMTAWMRRQNPSLITVAFSSAYQPDPGKAWSWLERLVRTWPSDQRAWQLDVGAPTSAPESQEEAEAWARWAQKPVQWRPSQGRFAPNAGFWLNAPAPVRTALLEKRITAVSPTAQDVVEAWNDPDLPGLEASPQAQALDQAALAARDALFQVWDGHPQRPPEAGGRGWGLAVRLGAQGHDRGCLALWSGLADLEAGARYAAQEATRDPRYPPVVRAEARGLTLQPALWGPWRPMARAEDFVPGFHSVMVVDGAKHTLLQAPLVQERGWSKAAFLDALAQKAELGAGGWHRTGLRWFRAVTLWGDLPVTTPK